MAANTSPIFVLVPQAAAVTIVPADTTSKKTLLTAGANGARVSSIIVATDETANRDVQLFMTISGTDYLLGTVQVPLGAGNTSGVVGINLLNQGYIPGLALDGSLLLPASAILKVASAATVTTAKTITFVAQYGDY